jgi:hypothetical protein
VIIPVKGLISDDYAVDKTWFDVELVPSGSASNEPRGGKQAMEFAMQKSGVVEASLDFRLQRSQDDGIEIRAKDKLIMAVKASDKHSLDKGPNVGSGDRYQFDVVSPDQLLSMLEAREIGLRRRFEQIIEEMTQARDFLKRAQPNAARGGDEPGDSAGVGDEPDDESMDPTEAARREQTLRVLRVQQALQQTRKSGQELLGVAASFGDIRQELINNRVDTEDRKKRLKELIADPMQFVGESMFPELERRANRLEEVLLADVKEKVYDLGIGTDEAQQATAQANDIIAEMEQILQQMLDLETFSELLDIVRQLIDDQQRIIDETEKERKQGLLRDLQ